MSFARAYLAAVALMALCFGLVVLCDRIAWRLQW